MVFVKLSLSLPPSGDKDEQAVEEMISLHLLSSDDTEEAECEIEEGEVELEINSIGLAF